MQRLSPFLILICRVHEKVPAAGHLVLSGSGGHPHIVRGCKMACMNNVRIRRSRLWKMF